MRQRFEDFPPRLYDAMARLILRQHGLLDSAASRLQSYRTALDQVMERGYAMVRVAGKLVTGAAQIAPGAILAIEFHDGVVTATAEGARPKPKRKRPAGAQGTLIALAMLALGVAGSAHAGTLALDGAAMEGGLVRGTVDPGTRLTLDGKPVRVAPDGHFIFGFGRDAAGHAALDALYPDGTTAHRDLGIAARQWDVRRIDGLAQEEVTPDPAQLARIAREDEEISKVRATDSDAICFEAAPAWPVIGTITGIYGSESILDGQKRAPHLGVDVTAPAGTPVRAAIAGTVTLAEPDLYLDGGTVIIDHGYGLSTTYIHLSSLAVKAGQKVAGGELIGTLGATGRATGPNLHWGLNWYQVRLDPQLAAGPMPK